MNEKLMNSVVSALVGGVVGAAVVFFVGGKTKFESLEIGDLTIKRSATFLNAEGREDVVIREGSVLANNVILGKKFIGTQYQGHVFIGNRIFTSPDDLMAKPMDQWRFFTEMGSTLDAGGEMIVRSIDGANVVGQEARRGVILRAGFNQESSPELFARALANGVTFPVAFVRPNVPQGPGAEGAEGAPQTTAETPVAEVHEEATNPGDSEIR